MRICMLRSNHHLFRNAADIAYKLLPNSPLNTASNEILLVIILLGVVLLPVLWLLLGIDMVAGEEAETVVVVPFFLVRWDDIVMTVPLPLLTKLSQSKMYTIMATRDTNNIQHNNDDHDDDDLLVVLDDVVVVELLLLLLLDASAIPAATTVVFDVVISYYAYIHTYN